MCGGRSSILYYGPLLETNYLYAPTPNGQKPECVAKQTQYLPPPIVSFDAIPDDNTIGYLSPPTQPFYKMKRYCV